MRRILGQGGHLGDTSVRGQGRHSDTSVTRPSARVRRLKYAFYPTGGFYQRHIDAMNVGRLAREWSFILYLNQARPRRGLGAISAALRLTAVCPAEPGVAAERRRPPARLRG